MATPIHPRIEWGARYPNGDAALFGPALEVAVHHSVTRAGLTPPEEREHMRELERIGQSRFRHGISYNVVIFPSGRAYEGVSWNRRGSHTGGHNSTVRSLCFVGNFEDDEPTPAALATAAGIVADGRGRLWREDAPVKGHRDYTDTACPGEHLYAELGVIATPPATPDPAPTKPTMEDDMPMLIGNKKKGERGHVLLVSGSSAVQIWPREDREALKDVLPLVEVTDETWDRLADTLGLIPNGKVERTN